MGRGWRIVSEYDVLVSQAHRSTRRAVEIRFQIVRRCPVIGAKIAYNHNQVDRYIVIATGVGATRPDLIAGGDVLADRPHVGGVFNFRQWKDAFRHAWNYASHMARRQPQQSEQRTDCQGCSLLRMERNVGLDWPIGGQDNIISHDGNRSANSFYEASQPVWTAMVMEPWVFPNLYRTRAGYVLSTR